MEEETNQADKNNNFDKQGYINDRNILLGAINEQTKMLNSSLLIINGFAINFVLFYLQDSNSSYTCTELFFLRSSVLLIILSFFLELYSILYSLNKQHSYADELFTCISEDRHVSDEVENSLDKFNRVIQFINFLVITFTIFALIMIIALVFLTS